MNNPFFYSVVLSTFSSIHQLSLNSQSTDSESLRNMIQGISKKQGLANLQRFDNYDFSGTFQIRGLVGKSETYWNWQQEKEDFNFSINGNLQTNFKLNPNKLKKLERQTFKGVPIKNTSWSFTVTPIPSFISIPPTLDESIRYVGHSQHELLNGKPMKTIEIERQHLNERTQFTFWINQETNVIEAVTLLIKIQNLGDTFHITKTIIFDDFRWIDGIFIPFKQSLESLKENINNRPYAYEFLMKSFKWNKL